MMKSISSVNIYFIWLDKQNGDILTRKPKRGMKKDGSDLQRVGSGSADADPRIRIRVVLMRIRNTAL